MSRTEQNRPRLYAVHVIHHGYISTATWTRTFWLYRRARAYRDAAHKYYSGDVSTALYPTPRAPKRNAR